MPRYLDLEDTGGMIVYPQLVAAEKPADLLPLEERLLSGLVREVTRYAAMRVVVCESVFQQCPTLMACAYAEQAEAIAAARRYARQIDCIEDRLAQFAKDGEGVDPFYELPLLGRLLSVDELMARSHAIRPLDGLAVFLRSGVGRKPQQGRYEGGLTLG